MTTGIYLPLAELVLQNSIYLSCLSWLAWRAERSSGRDAFHLVMAYALSALVLSFLVNQGMLSCLFAAAIACVLSNLIENWMATRYNAADEKESLVVMIVIASLALIAFDWITAHTPISFPIGTVDYRRISWFCAAGAWTLIGVKSKSPAGLMERLGSKNWWAIEFWGRPLPKQPMYVLIISFLCWLPVILVPISTTGLLSSTILKDVTIAITIARVASIRGEAVVLLACVTLAILRAAAGFFFLSNIGPPVVEAAVFLCLLVWLRYRGSRTAWEGTVVR